MHIYMDIDASTKRSQNRSKTSCLNCIYTYHKHAHTQTRILNIRRTHTHKSRNFSMHTRPIIHRAPNTVFFLPATRNHNFTMPPPPTPVSATWALSQFAPRWTPSLFESK